MEDCRKTPTFAKLSDSAILAAEVNADSVRRPLETFGRKTFKPHKTPVGSESGLSPPTILTHGGLQKIAHVRKTLSHAKLPSEVNADSVRLSLPDPFVNRLRIAHVRRTDNPYHTRVGSERGLSPPA